MCKNQGQTQKPVSVESFTVKENFKLIFAITYASFISDKLLLQLNNNSPDTLIIFNNIYSFQNKTENAQNQNLIKSN